MEAAFFFAQALVFQGVGFQEGRGDRLRPIRWSRLGIERVARDVLAFVIVGFRAVGEYAHNEPLQVQIFKSIG